MTRTLYEPGHVIDGKYRLVRIIGTGGMGSVYEGENLLIRRRVAIKILNSGTTQNADAIKRFEREAQAAGEIGNDHILEVLDLGSLPNGDRYLVMEYLDGETLAARIERHGRLSPIQISPIARQFLTALASAHAAGIIHRDLKPENIFILRSKAGRVDFVKLIDFGISKFSRRFTEGEQRMTRADAVLGTPVYMSPEQARGARETDVRSDIYSCGVILYESVTGRVPFDGDSFNDLMFKIALSDAPSPLAHVPSLDPEFSWIIERAIKRDPNERFASAQEFAEALDNWMRKNQLTETLSMPRPSDAFPTRHPSIPVTADTETLGAEDVEALRLKTGTPGSWANSRGAITEPGRRKRMKLATFSAGGLVLVGLVIAMLVRGEPPPTAAAARLGSASALPATAGPPRAAPSAVLPPVPSAAPSASASASSSAPARPSPAAHPATAPAQTAEKPKPRSSTVSTKSFDLGY
ncbi:MAG TPA: serine/threonine-protein kinase [Polyangiaceae bacterium]|nr:serine/threonine-protein kinase [Polyangiaceae bacterium]